MRNIGVILSERKRVPTPLANMKLPPIHQFHPLYIPTWFRWQLCQSYHPKAREEEHLYFHKEWLKYLKIYLVREKPGCRIFSVINIWGSWCSTCGAGCGSLTSRKGAIPMQTFTLEFHFRNRGWFNINLNGGHFFRLWGLLFGHILVLQKYTCL